MSLLVELFRAPSEVEDTDRDQRSTMTLDSKISFSHDPELSQTMKERFSSEEFVKTFEEEVYNAIVATYRKMQNASSRYAGDDWIDDMTVECKLRSFNSSAFESAEAEKTPNVMYTLADAYNKALDMIHSIAEADGNADVTALEKQIEAARKGLGIVNKLKAGPDKVKHAARVMSNLNKLRAKLKKLKKELASKEIESKESITESVTIRNSILNEYVTYNIEADAFMFESKHKKEKKTIMGKNNPVAKNDKNKSSVHRDKKNDYTRKEKFKKDNNE